MWSAGLKHGSSAAGSKAKAHHYQLSLDILRAIETVVFLALTERVRVQVRSEVAHSGADALIEGGAVGEMAAEAHACRAHTAVAAWE